MAFQKSEDLFKRAKASLPAGVSASLRKFAEVKTPPLFIAKGEGAFLYDVDGNRYVDFMSGLGPLILGHAHPKISAAMEKQLRQGALYAAASELEVELAEKIIASSPSLEQIRFVSSGTEAVMSAVRLAKHCTRRSKVVKFEGCYHGHSDAVQGKGIHTAQAGGVDPHIHQNTLLCEYNNGDELRHLFETSGDEIAAVLIEPFASNMNLVKPDREFIRQAREMCTRFGALLIFDEVVTGFRLTYGSVAKLLDITPDLVVFGKIIGGGTPIGAYGGKKTLMQEIDRCPTFQGGTYAGNPLTMAAGLATLDVLQTEPVYEHLNRLGARLVARLKPVFARKGFLADHAGSIVSLIFCSHALRNLQDTLAQDEALFSGLHLFLAKRGFLLSPSVHEPLFLSYAHTQEQIEGFVQAMDDFFNDE